ncbi:MAG TPA: hypothetical protein VF163_19465 [Micromonosporaceae bacterium]
MRSSKVLRVISGALAALATLAIAACGTDEKYPAGRANTAAATGAAVGQTVTIGKSFWHAGWQVELVKATTKSAKVGRGTVVAVDAVFHNLGTETSEFDSHLLLSGGGVDASLSPLDSDIPVVPGAGKQNGVLGFQISADFTLNNAVLTIGNPANNQAVVPFGGTGTLVTQEPRTVPLELAGSITYPIYNKPGTIAIKVTGGELRADIPAGHNEVKKGQLALTLRYAVTYTYADIYSYYWNDNNLLLRLPDGTTIDADLVDGVPNLKPGATASDLTARFLIKDPAAGNYALILKSNNGSTPTREIPFALTLS